MAILPLAAGSAGALDAAADSITVRNWAGASYLRSLAAQREESTSNTVAVVVGGSLGQSAPAISLNKTAGPPRRVGELAWEVDFQLVVTNSGDAAAPYVRLFDNLDCTFRTFEAPAPALQWRIVSPPRVVNGILRANPGYTGSAACSAQQAKQAQQVQQVQLRQTQVGIPTQQTVDLVDGAFGLAPGASETVRFSVRFELSPVAGPRPIFTNTGFAASYDAAVDGAALLDAATSSVDFQVLDPSGVVYDVKTRQPVPGAVVRMRRTRCEGTSAGPITSDQVVPVAGLQYTFNSDGTLSMPTGSDGGYYVLFKAPPVAQACEYGIDVAPPPATGYMWQSVLIPALPEVAPGGAVQPQPTAPKGADPTSYYLRMRLGPGLPDVWNNHIPVDPPISAGALMLQKTANKSAIEIGGSVQYEVSLKNGSAIDIYGFTITDTLPQGFRYLKGTSRLEGQRIADPAVSGRALRYEVSGAQLRPNTTVKLAYVAQAGVSTPVGDAINTAQAVAGRMTSNVASTRVRVLGGVFSDEAYLVGKVFLDCNGDRVQGPGEPGIPGVRVLLEDGTSAVTDGEGKYSLYGLKPITHVVKVDSTTLPEGAELAVLDSRNSGRGDSRFADLKKGEMHKADFAVANCAAANVKAEVERRRQALADKPDSEGVAVSRAKLDLQPPTQSQPLQLNQLRSRESAGVLTAAGPSRAASAPAASAQVFEPVTTGGLRSDVQSVSRGAAPRPALEDSLVGLDNTLAFIDLKDGDTLPMAVANVRVKGHAGSTLELEVNGRVVAPGRVGKRSRLADKALEAWEYIGIELHAGENTLVLKELDGVGIARGTQSLRLIAPGSPGRIEIELPKAVHADGRTRVPVRVRLLDDKGVPVTARTQLTLEVETGRWDVKDLNPKEAGTQVFMEGGTAEYGILPPTEPGETKVRVSAGSISREARIVYLPELRPLVGAGIVEGVLDFRGHGLLPVGQSARDTFEQTLRSLSQASGTAASGRVAFYLKGTIKGEYLLTASYDSDKSAREQLFRDIQPEKFYPIYGDSSAKLFDAQSTGRLYVRVDSGRSWMLLGDFTTASDSEARKLSQYNRAATGARYHYENDKVKANAFASRDSLTQVVKELPANGTSGPYPLGNASVAPGSERIEILVRDRAQPAIILKTIPMSRLADYVLEPLTGELLFAAPVASLDENLNPRWIRVTYEAESGGPQFWVAGGDVQVKATENVQLGASFAHDANPANPTTLAGATAVVKLGERSAITAEVAQSQTGASGTGHAARVEVLQGSGNLKLRAQASASDARFDNPTAGFGKAHAEATVDATYQLDKSQTLRAEGIYSRDGVTGTERAGLLATYATPVGEQARAEVGLRVSRNTTFAVAGTDPTSPPAPVEPAAPGQVSASDNMVTLRGRLSTRMPQLGDGQVYVEAEQDIAESRRRMLAVGADYQLSPQAKVYGRYELISSLGNPYTLNSTAQNNVAVVGLETSYLKDGRTFNEFRIRDTINGREMQAASGVRRTWAITERLRVGGSFENTKAFGGVAGSNSTAVTGSVEYAEENRLRTYGSAEVRRADTGDSGLLTLGLALKLDKDWSMLGRVAESVQKNSREGSETIMSREQIGFAWRQTDLDVWNALGKYEHTLRDVRGGTTPTREESHAVSLSVNFQPARSTVVSGRYAYKWGEETIDDVLVPFRGQLLSARLTQDINGDFDVSAQAALVSGSGGGRYALGLEGGWHAVENLWIALGYNWVGVPRSALSQGEYLDRGPYLRVRYKFDEGVLR